MAQFPITIPDDKVSTLVNAFASVHDYEANKLDGENKVQFAKRMIRVYIRNVYDSYIIDADLKATRQAAAATAAAESDQIGVG